MPEFEKNSRHADVVVLTAIPLEYRAVLDVEAGAWPGSKWEQDVQSPYGLPVSFRIFRGRGDRPLRVAVAQARDMGAVKATQALIPLVDAYRPSCIAMCGVCAGRPGKTNLGDVIVADRLFFHDTGKQRPTDIQQDITTYNLREDWKVDIEHFDFTARFREELWWSKRPIPYVWQEIWLLAQVHKGLTEPWTLPECEVFCPQWKKILEGLWRSADLKSGELVLTEAGTARIKRELLLYQGRIPDLSPSGFEIPFRVHVAPMGSGNKVIEDEAYWSFISDHMRKTLGLEMEAVAIGSLAHAMRSQRARGLDALVMKGVMDFANHGRDDHFKEFAARAAAECLLAFLREHVTPEVVPNIDDILVSGEEPLPSNPPPSALLVPRYQVVPFYEPGREAVLAELDRWCVEGSAVAVRLIHAEGGVGKTRLAMKWAQLRRDAGWAAGFLATDPPDGWFERLWTLERSVAVVIDYAESRSWLGKALLRVLRYQQQMGTSVLRRMRILLLARNSGDWWQSLKQSNEALGNWLGAIPPHELAPLAKPADREALFSNAAESFALMRGKPRPERPPIPLSDPRFKRVLYIHMAALASVDGLPFEANTLMDVILDHEERFWCAEGCNDFESAEQRRSARQIVAAATLRGGLAERADAAVVAERLFRPNLLGLDQKLLLRLHRVYQRKQGGPFIPALEPDLLGEGVVLRVISPSLDEDRVPIEWIDQLFPEDDDARAIVNGLEVLGRASATKPKVIRPWLEQMLARALFSRALLALIAAKSVGTHTALSVLGEVLADQLEARGDVSVAQELHAAKVLYPTVSLARVNEWTSRTLLSTVHASMDEKVLGDQAQLLFERAVALTNLGRRDEALSASLEAVKRYRALAEHNPDSFLHDLARSLLNLGATCKNMGRRQEAVEATSEAVHHFRILGQKHPDALLDLASCLNNFGEMLSNIGRTKEALDATSEALQLRRSIAENRPDALIHELATSFHNFGNRLGEMGKREEALDATFQGVQRFRSLAERYPDAFLPDLALSLSNLCGRLLEQSRIEEALSAISEAVHHYRTLVDRNAGAFLPDLALSLSNFGTTLSRLRRTEEALSVVAEAVQHYRTLVDGNADAFLHELAMALNNLGMMQGKAGFEDRALQTISESVQHYRFLANHNPNVFLPLLATSIHNLGVSLSDLGQKEEALAATREAVQLRRTLVERNPDAFLPDLATSLVNLGNRLSEVGSRKEALSVTLEAVQCYRYLVEKNSDAFLPGLAMSVGNLGSRWGEINRLEEAVKATREAIVYYRVLAEHNPDAFVLDLAGTLNNLGAMLSESGGLEEAVGVLEEAIDKLWPSFERHPLVFSHNAAIMLAQLFRLHTLLQRPLSLKIKERITTLLQLRQA